MSCTCSFIKFWNFIKNYIFLVFFVSNFQISVSKFLLWNFKTTIWYSKTTLPTQKQIKIFAWVLSHLFFCGFLVLQPSTYCLHKKWICFEIFDLSKYFCNCLDFKINFADEVFLKAFTSKIVEKLFWKIFITIVTKIFLR